jgi:nitrogen fixation protein NifU and related proteins
MSELRELYQQVILDHNKAPRNFGPLANATASQEGRNPLCGDHLHIHLQLDDDRNIDDIHFEGDGCAISKASASIMTAALKGKSRTEAEELFNIFHAMVTASTEEAVDTERVGKLAVFAGVREFPMRIKCATLAWHTMKAALDGDDEPITTE